MRESRILLLIHSWYDIIVPADFRAEFEAPYACIYTEDFFGAISVLL